VARGWIAWLAAMWTRGAIFSLLKQPDKQESASRSSSRDRLLARAAR
jgi:hypothetical protein